MLTLDLGSNVSQMKKNIHELILLWVNRMQHAHKARPTSTRSPNFHAQAHAHAHGHSKSQTHSNQNIRNVYTERLKQ